MNNKRGSVSVFLLTILLSMVLVIGFMLEAASGRACRSFGEGVLSMGAESVMTEYNRALKDNYGLFAFLGEKDLIESRLKMYSDVTFNKSTTRTKQMDLLRVKLNNVAVDLGEKSITNLDIFEKEIKKYMAIKAMTIIADKISNTESSLEEVKKGEALTTSKSKDALDMENSLKNLDDTGDGESGAKVREGKKKLKELKEKYDREANSGGGTDGSGQVLRDEGVIQYLPSQNNDQKEMFWDFSNLGNKLITNSYIITTFSNSNIQKARIPTFFKNEVEYIVMGNLDDNKNLEMVKNRLLIMRIGLNMAHIYSSPDKVRQLVAAASALTPGPWSPITQIILAGIWAGIESNNDLKLLKEGKKVPILKKDKHWAITLQNILAGEWSGESIGNGEDGLDYEGYLMLMLTAGKRSDTLLRTMDLIQINIKGNYDQTFILKNYYTGFSYRCELKKESGFFGLMGKDVRLGEVEGEIEY